MGKTDKKFIFNQTTPIVKSVYDEEDEGPNFDDMPRGRKEVSIIKINEANPKN